MKTRREKRKGEWCIGKKIEEIEEENGSTRGKLIKMVRVEDKETKTERKAEMERSVLKGEREDKRKHDKEGITKAKRELV